MERDRRAASEMLEELKGWGYRETALPVWLDQAQVEAGLKRLGINTCKFIAPDGRVMVLLPDPTLAVIDQLVRPADPEKPQRYSYWTRVFRIDDRQNWVQLDQIGAELIGPSSPLADAELVTVALRALLRAGDARYRLYLNDVPLTAGLTSLLDPPERAQAARRALQRGDFVTLQQICEHQPYVLELLRFSGSWQELASVLAQVPGSDADRLHPVRQRLQRLVALIELVELAVPQLPILIDLTMVRDLGYYDGFVFQLLASGSGRFVAGGGRYDGLLRERGVNAGGAGFACDLTAVAENVALPEPPAPQSLSLAGAAPHSVWRQALQLRQQNVAIALVDHDRSPDTRFPDDVEERTTHS